MREENVQEAREAAERFLKATDKLIARIDNMMQTPDVPPITWHALKQGIGCKESGAVRRTSLELTRALADLRQR